MIARIMSKEVTTASVQEMDDYIRLFLCCTDDFDSVANPSRTEPMWLRKGNFLSMLNFPNVAARFGPIPLYWDGNREKYIQLIKPLMKGVKHQSSTYLTTKLTQVHENASMAQLIGTLDSLMLKRKHYQRYTSIHCYPSNGILEDDIANGRPISGFAFLRNNTTNIVTILVCVRGGGEDVLFHQITFNDSNGVINCGLWFAPITLASFNLDDNDGGDQVKLTTLEDMDRVAVAYVVLTSSRRSNEDNHIRYCLLAKNWHERNKHGMLVLPGLDNSTFTATSVEE